MVLTQRIRVNAFRVLVYVAALAPLALLLWDYARGSFLVDLVREVTSRTGKTALILLILSLACTPLNTVFRFKLALQVRRSLGLYAFLYAGLHFLTFIWLDYGLDFRLIVPAIVEQRFIVAGFAALLLLLPLAITSTRGWMKRLGKRWNNLHHLVYLAGALAVVHFFWSVKDYRQPAVYAGVLLLLLLLRVPPVRAAVSRARRRFRPPVKVRPLPPPDLTLIG